MNYNNDTQNQSQVKKVKNFTCGEDHPLYVYNEYGFNFHSGKKTKDYAVKRDITISFEQAAELQSKNYYIPCSIPENIIVIDADDHPGKNPGELSGVENFKRLLNEYQAGYNLDSLTMTVKTATGQGKHYVFTGDIFSNIDRQSINTNIPGIDLLIKGHLLMSAGSPGYTLLNDLPPAPLPPELVAWCETLLETKSTPDKKTDNKNLYPLELLQAILNELPVKKFRNYKDWEKLLMSLVVTFGDSGQVKNYIFEWAINDTLYCDHKRVLKNIQGFKRDKIKDINTGTLSRILNFNGLSRFADIIEGNVRPETVNIDMLKTRLKGIPEKESNIVKIWTGEELDTTEFPEVEYIIPGIIPQGLTVLAGISKMGKSWLALDIATSLSSGGEILGRPPVKPATVLYLALEDIPRRLKDRRKKQGIKVIKNNCETLFAFKTADTGFLFLHEQMEKYPDIKLIIIDTAARFLKIKQNNDYNETNDAYAALKKFADDYNISIIAITHVKKAETDDFVHSVIGSTGITGAADTILVLARKRGEADAKLSITGRDIEEKEFAVSFNKEHCRWSILGDAADYAESQEQQEILDILKTTKQTMGPAEIAGILEKNPGAVRFLLIKMRDAGLIKSPVYGKYEYIQQNTTNTTNTSNTTNTTNTTNTLNN
jgi:hypothetical protein